MEEVYKFLNGRSATHASDFRYRLNSWQPEINGNLVACKNAYHGCKTEHLSSWIASDLFVIESKSDWFEKSGKLITRGPVRIIEHLKGWNIKNQRLFAVDAAEHVLHFFEKTYPNDNRPRLAIQAARKFSNSQISTKELFAAYANAVKAAHAANAVKAAYAANAAATAANAAAFAAAFAAAAANAAANAANAAAANAAERMWQGERILYYAKN